jgi:hypothetical protein
MAKLVMGTPKAEEIRRAHRDMQLWLARERPCPLCNDPDFWDEDEDLLPSPEPDLDCPLCEGESQITGAHVAEYALLTGDLWLLPSWMDVESLETYLERPKRAKKGGKTAQNGLQMAFEVR